MEITGIAKELSALPVESSSSAGTTSTSTSTSSSAASSTTQPVSNYSAQIDGQTEGVQVSEVNGTYFAGVPGPPAVTASGASLTGAEDNLSYIVNLFV